MELITADARRVTETPNGVMRTLASPTLGGSRASLWTVEMPPHQEGPVHAFAEEVLWAFLTGSATLRVDGDEIACAAGDTAVLPAGVMRQLVAGPEGFTAVVTTPTPCEVTRDSGESAGVPPWVS